MISSRSVYRFKVSPVYLLTYDERYIYEGNNVDVYLDVVFFCGKDARSKLDSLEAVLLKLRQTGLKAKLTKREFLKSRIKFLGHVVDG